MKTIIQHCLQDHLALLTTINETYVDHIEKFAKLINDCLHVTGGSVFWCGNGGSASDAEHLCAELVGRFQRDRSALSAYALSANSSTVTSIANDFGYESIFSRQIEGLAKAGDVLVCISTSGNSANVIHAAKSAKAMGLQVLGLLGNSGGELNSLCDLSIVIPHNNTARIQEMHILIGHIVCQLVEA